jgi:hypothetical protein
MDHYSAAKITCENLVKDGVGANRSLILRPGLIGGEGDLSGRTGYWPWRYARAAAGRRTVLIPDPRGRDVQIFDLHDLAEWTVQSICAGLFGTFNMVGDTISMTDFFSVCRSLRDTPIDEVVASSEWLSGQGVSSWAGPRSLPLWIAEPGYEGFARWSGVKARAHGFRTRPLLETLREVAEWELSRTNSERAAGLTDDEERVLLDTLAASKG